MCGIVCSILAWLRRVYQAIGRRARDTPVGQQAWHFRKAGTPSYRHNPIPRCPMLPCLPTYKEFAVHPVPGTAEANILGCTAQVNVYWHIIQSGGANPKGALTTSAINDQMNVLNRLYATTGIQFNVPPPTHPLTHHPPPLLRTCAGRHTR